MRRVVIRTCVGCGAKRPKEELMRLAHLPNCEVRYDPDQKLFGRGAYVCPNRECIRRAFKRGRMGKALKAPVPAEMRELLLKALDLLSEGGE